MSQPQTQPTGLNEMQLTLLRMFNRPMSEQETAQLRDLLTDHYANLLFNSVNNDVAERGITQVDYDRLRQGNQ